MSILIPIENKNQVDKALVAGQSYKIDPTTQDLVTVNNEYSILQAVQNRILAERGSWIYDDNYGSTLNDFLKSGQTLTEGILSGIIKQALEPMMKDGRVTSLDRVLLLSRKSDTVIFEITLTLGQKKVSQTYKVNFL